MPHTLGGPPTGRPGEPGSSVYTWSRLNLPKRGATRRGTDFLFAKSVPARKDVIPWDLRYYHLPLTEFLARSLLRGNLPLWGPGRIWRPPDAFPVISLPSRRGNTRTRLRRSILW